jgi:hypothetical protein
LPTFFVRVTTSPTVKPAVSSYTCNECRNHKYEPGSQLAASSHILVAAVCTRMVSAARLSHQQALRGSHPCMLPADKPQRAEHCLHLLLYAGPSGNWGAACYWLRPPTV